MIDARAEDMEHPARRKDDMATSVLIVGGGVVGANAALDPAMRSAVAPTTGGVEVLVAVARELAEARIPIEDLSLRQPTLDEVFLILTGGVPGDTTEGGL